MAGWPVEKNAAFNVQFPIYDADGDLVTAAASLDSEVSKDGGTFTDCTNEAAEVATSSGVYKLVLTATEMDADEVAVITKTGTAGAKTAVNMMYTSIRQIDDLAFPTVSGRSTDVLATGEVGIDLDNVNGTLDAAEIGAAALTSAKFAAGAIDANAIAADAIGASEMAAGAIAADAFAAGAIDAAALNADAVTEIRSLVSGTADSGSSTTMVDAARTEADDVFNGLWIMFTSGAIDNQVRLITDFVASSDTTTFTPALTGSVGTETYEILAAGAVDVAWWLQTAPNALVSGRVDASVGAMAAAVVTAAAIATDALDADALAADAANEIADAILKRDLDQVEATMALHSLGTACLKAVSRIRDNAGTLEVYETDGVTLHMSQTVTTDGALDPVDELTAGS